MLKHGKTVLINLIKTLDNELIPFSLDRDKHT